MRESLTILTGDLVTAGPELLLFLKGQALHPSHQDFRFLHEHRKFAAGKYIRIDLHLRFAGEIIILISVPHH